jgi:hypothetical protein
MESGGENGITRRSFMGTAALAGSAAPAFTIVKPEQVRGVGKEMLKLGILGVGMRGSQAVMDTPGRETTMCSSWPSASCSRTGWTAASPT